MENFSHNVILISVIFFGITIRKAIIESSNQRKKEMKELQDWLFNQLYSIAPGKVLRPEEKESEMPRKAVVIHHSRDPMNEFNGKKDDWD